MTDKQKRFFVDVVASGLGEIGKLLGQYEQLNHQLQTEYDDKLMQKLEKLQQQIEFNDAWKNQQKIESVISSVFL